MSRDSKSLVWRCSPSARCVALACAAIALSRGDRATAYQDARHNVGRAILLGLEVLIIADIVQTITIEPTAESALVLGVIVLVRTFLSFSLEIELDGVVPWRRAIAAHRSPQPGGPESPSGRP